MEVSPQGTWIVSKELLRWQFSSNSGVGRNPEFERTGRWEDATDSQSHSLAAVFGCFLYTRMKAIGTTVFVECMWSAEGDAHTKGAILSRKRISLIGTRSSKYRQDLRKG